VKEKVVDTKDLDDEMAKIDAELAKFSLFVPNIPSIEMKNIND